MIRTAPDAADRGYLRRRRRMIARALWFTVASGGLLLFASLRVVRAVAHAASCRARRAAVLLVPGHRLDGGEVGPCYAERLQRAFGEWRRAPERVLLLSGGASASGEPSEAEAGLVHLYDLGLPPQATVWLDRHARDTEENLLNAAALIDAAQRADPIDPAAVVVISQRWHLARCAWLARHHGLPWRMCAAEPRRRRDLRSRWAEWREALSLLSMAGYDAARIEPRQLLRPGS